MPMPPPLPRLADAEGEGEGEPPAGPLGVVPVLAGVEGVAAGAELPPPGPFVVAVAVGRGSAEVTGRIASTAEPVRGARTVVPGAGVVPSLGTGAVPGVTPADCDGRAERVGSGEVRTWLAGLSSPCAGAGSQGASGLPDTRVATMTTA
ncbi:hypothetical protein ACWEN3_13040 [Streptomyces sp. NPDC004561]